MEPLAHSARPKEGIPPQYYSDHVREVIELASQNACQAAYYWCAEKDGLLAAVRLAAEFHDLGKLEQANQDVLMSGSQRKSLPVNHVDAGVAHLFDPGINNLLAASLVHSHHLGLPDFQDQRLNGPGKVLRDLKDSELGQATMSLTDQRLTGYLKIHEKVLKSLIPEQEDAPGRGPSPLPAPLFRIALSCLVDADHFDTSRHYGKVRSRAVPPLSPHERLALLDAYVAALPKNEKDERGGLRSEVYTACRNADPNPGLYACDSPVGRSESVV